MRVGQSRKRDANEKAIRKALEAAGAIVMPISGEGAPDLLVSYRGDLYALEVKSQIGTRTEAQKARSGRLCGRSMKRC
jgi:Holliday junction resolvase